MNVYVPIDPSWSYKFFEQNKAEIGRVPDFFKFMDRFYTCAMTYVTAYINYRFGLTGNAYNDHITTAMSVCNEYPSLGPLIQQAYRELYSIHRLSFEALQASVVNLQTICNDTGILTGIVFTLNNRSV